MLVFSVWPAQGCEEMNIGVRSFRQFVCPKRKEYPVETLADEQFNRVKPVFRDSGRPG
jgi:hypothetical protein